MQAIDVITLDTLVAEAKYKRHITTTSGHSLWLVCDRPFADAATDILRDAIHSCKPVPSVLSPIK